MLFFLKHHDKSLVQHFNSTHSNIIERLVEFQFPLDCLFNPHNIPVQPAPLPGWVEQLDFTFFKHEIVRGNKFRNTKWFITFHAQQYFLQMKTSILVPIPKLTLDLV